VSAYSVRDNLQVPQQWRNWYAHASTKLVFFFLEYARGLRIFVLRRKEFKVQTQRAKNNRKNKNNAEEEASV
jgi:hypothetical protein